MPHKPGTSRHPRRGSDSSSPRSPATLRIIGGKFRGRKIQYAGDPRVRPMKNRIREAVFNLVGPQIKGLHALDLFAGTGALGLEAISRGAGSATLVERHFPTAKVIRENVELLKCDELVQIVTADTFVWVKTSLPKTDGPWAVFCSPPYVFYRDRFDDMYQLLTRIIGEAPSGSVVCVEAENDLLPGQLPTPDRWDARPYPPAIIAVYRKT